MTSAVHLRSIEAVILQISYPVLNLSAMLYFLNQLFKKKWRQNIILIVYSRIFLDSISHRSITTKIKTKYRKIKEKVIKIVIMVQMKITILNANWYEKKKDNLMQKLPVFWVMVI